MLRCRCVDTESTVLRGPKPIFPKGIAQPNTSPKLLLPTSHAPRQGDVAHDFYLD